MKIKRLVLGAIWAVGFLIAAACSTAATFPTPQESDWTIPDFRFRSGEVMPELRIHFTTVGAPSGEPVLILHGTTQSGTSMLGPDFGGELFGSGQPLDASRYFVILPDAMARQVEQTLRWAESHLSSTADMVDAQHRLVTEHLGIRHLRLALGFSMGGMGPGYSPKISIDRHRSARGFLPKIDVSRNWWRLVIAPF
jgi:homoserine O-acetyltransferase